MQLSRLEIKGFKSFGDRVLIHFDDGVTGIVGPNGCGKSNVVDAIRWVLGEQKTRVLRSDKMENIIFNGTKARKPAQFAEVSLTFLNNKQILPAEFKEITVMRKYYRNGDSQYFLNEVPCRLKDINNLFLDTGIGSDSYAIIELKMIDEILTDRENSRRSLFEKAAGIAKFKVKKRETEAQLELVDKDLARVEDILAEILKNLKSLEKQAKQAEKYFELKNLYKKASLSFARKTIQRQQQLMDALSEQMAQEVDKRNQLIELADAKDFTLEKEKQNVVDSETIYYERQRELNEHQSKLRSLENEKKIKNERLRYLTEKTQSLQIQISQDQTQKTEIQKNLEDLTAKQAEAQKELAGISRELDVLREQYENQRRTAAEIQQQSNAANEQYRAKQENLFQLNKKLEIKQIQLQTLQGELQQISIAIENFQQNIASQADSYQQIETQYLKAKTDAAQAQEADAQQAQKVQQLETQIAEQSRLLRNLTRTLDAKRTEYSLTQALIDSMEGLPDAFQYLNTEQKRWSSEKPLLLKQVLQYSSENGISVENYLEPWLNYYIVDTAEQAYQAIRLLEADQKGKAGFFVLDKIPEAGSLQFKLADTKTKAAPAILFVKTEAKYKALVYWLLKEVFVVEDEQVLQATDLGNAQAVITKNGVLQKNSLGLKGGSAPVFEQTQTGRRQQMEALEAEILPLSEQVAIQESQIEQWQAELQNLKSQNLREIANTTQQTLNALQEQFFSTKAQYEQAGIALETNQAKAAELQTKIEDLQQETKKLAPQIEEEETLTKDLGEKLADLNERLNTENEALTTKSSAYNQQNILFHQQKGKADTIDQELNFKSESLHQLADRLAKNQTDFEKSNADIQVLEANLHSDDEVIEGLLEQSEEYKERLQMAEKEYFSVKGRIAEIEKEIKEVQRQKELVDALLNELNRKQTDIRLELTAVRERLAAEFEIDADALMQAQPAEEEEEEENTLSEFELKARMDDLKKQIERIGAINPMAMESYNEMKERYDFIEVQRNDLHKSKDDLLKTIQEMENFAKTAFLKAFEQIRLNFIHVFRSLFSEEDTADLILTDPEMPLESKIDIVAKPKGKRPLTISQLSGGEKTLTATALLFAIYLLKPAPFCIFDEVDAPLDDTNTDKFNQIIKKFSKDSQFIIVTHNKRTMASTDVMYGITMPEQGVSRVVPVDLRSLA